MTDFSTASKWLHRTERARITTQGGAAVWCNNVVYIMPLERRHGVLIPMLSPVGNRKSSDFSCTSPTLIRQFAVSLPSNGRQTPPQSIECGRNW